MDNILNNLPLEKRDLKAALLWGAVLLVIMILVRASPVTDVYYLLLNVWHFIVNTFVFLEATLDVIAYVLLLLLFATLAFAVATVSRAWSQRRKKQSHYC